MASLEQWRTGDVFQVDEQRRIHLQDGRALPEIYKRFTHFAVAAHRSQGKSVDVVIIAGGMRKEARYVAASRCRDSIAVVTSDKRVLR